MDIQIATQSADGLSEAEIFMVNLCSQSLEFLAFKMYKESDNKFYPNSITVICRTAISFHLKENPRLILGTQQLQKIDMMLAEGFGVKQGTFYKGPTGGKNAEGPLFSAYRYFKEILQAVKIRDKEKTRNKTTPDATVSEGPEVTFNETFSDILEDDFIFVKTVTPRRGELSMFMLKWDETFDIRQVKCSKMSSQEIFEIFPAFQEDVGLDMMISDATKKGVTLPSSDYIAKVIQCIFDELKAKPNNDLRKYLKSFDGEANVTVQTVIALSNLAQLVKMTSKQKHLKTSKPAAQLGFMTLAKKDPAKKYVPQYDLMVRFLGDLSDPSESFAAEVHVFGTTKIFSDIFDAINFIFCSYSTLGTNFPEQSAILWALFSKLYFKTTSSTVDAFLNNSAKKLIATIEEKLT